MGSLNASDLSPILNAYSIDPGPPRTIAVPGAARLAGLQDITVNGKLLKKQLVRLDKQTNRRKPMLTANNGQYRIESGDGDLHFCVGARQLQPHIACELQNAKAWLAAFNGSIGNPISVSGFFRCMFEHPGFRSNDDAHIFEIHPVRAVNLAGSIQAFDVDVPEQNAIHTWNDPHPLNDQDNAIKVSYDNPSDTLTFTGMQGQDENYVRVPGAVSNLKLNLGGQAPATFTFTSDEIGHPIQALCLQGTSAAHQLRTLSQPNVTMVVLRNIDLAQALEGKYVISLLGIDIQES